MTDFIKITDTTFKLDHPEAERYLLIGDQLSVEFKPVCEVIPWLGELIKIEPAWNVAGLSTDISSKTYLLIDNIEIASLDTKEDITQLAGENGISLKFRLTQKPKIDPDGFARFDFSVYGHEEFAFHHQAALTEKDLLPGESVNDRPQHVVDSYAVYHLSKRNGRFRTGKAFHLYRPWCKDSLGNFYWGKWEWNAASGILRKCIPSEAFDQPAIWWDIDFTLGNDSAGTTASTNASYTWEFQYTEGEGGGNCSTIHASCDNTDTSAHYIRLAIFDDASNVPQDCVDGDNTRGVEIEIPGSGAKDTRSTDFGGSLSNGAEYHTMGCMESGFGRIYYDAVSGGSYQSQNYAAVAIAGGGSWTSISREHSIWVEYAAGGENALPMAMNNYRRIRI